MAKLRRRLYHILEVAAPGGSFSRFVDTFLMALIITNVIAAIVGTVPAIATRFGRPLAIFELFSVGLFTIEYLLRLWVIVEDDRYAAPLLGRLKYIISPMALVDLAAILPFYLPLQGRVDLRFVRILRLFRIFRLLKMVRYSNALKLFGEVIRMKKAELLLALWMVVVILIFVSSLMYVVEHDAQPVAFGSIPAAMWWGIISLTTVGYGDVYPITALGQVLGGVIALLGVGLIAIPTGILASGFVEVIRRHTTHGKTCPHCGEKIE